MQEEVRVDYPKRLYSILTEKDDKLFFLGIQNEEILLQVKEQLSKEKFCILQEFDLKKILKEALDKKNFKVDSYKEYIDKLNQLVNKIRSYTTMPVHLEEYIEYGDPIQIFISHSSRTDTIAEAFVELLTKHEIKECDIINIHDRKYLELLPASDYIYPINEFIQKSEAFVSIMDKNFLSSQMCNVEVGMALASNCLILPIFESEPNRKDDRLFNNHHIEFLDDMRYLKKIISLLDRTPNEQYIDEFIAGLELLRFRIEKNDQERIMKAPMMNGNDEYIIQVVKKV